MVEAKIAFFATSFTVPLNVDAAYDFNKAFEGKNLHLIGIQELIKNTEKYLNGNPFSDTPYFSNVDFNKLNEEINKIKYSKAQEVIKFGGPFLSIRENNFFCGW